MGLLNSLCYTIGWFWCVIWGAQNHSFLAFLGAVLLILLQLYVTAVQSRKIYIQDALLVIFSIPLGYLLEFFFIQTGLIKYTDSPNFPPIWIVLLYPLFVLLLNHSLDITRKYIPLAFLLGALFAPLSYLGGEAFGGVTFPKGQLSAALLLGPSWGIFLVLLCKIANSIEEAAAETFLEKEKYSSLELLYDGDCPICKREICYLQTKKPVKAMKFVDISGASYRKEEHQNIDYMRAMETMHAINARGEILIGLPAFAAVYARCNLLLLSTLLRIPLIKWMGDPLYAFFAKNRLWLTGRDKRA